MRTRILLAVCVLALSCTGMAQRRKSTYGGSVHVRGHVTKEGTYVPAHRRTAADGRFGNNWSTKGNSNPYTGKAGTRVTPPKKRRSDPFSEVPGG